MWSPTSLLNYDDFASEKLANVKKDLLPVLLLFEITLYLKDILTDTIFILFFSQGRDPRAVDARGPISGQRVPVAGGMQGPPPHGMGQSAPPAARPVRFPDSCHFALLAFQTF